MSPAIWIPIVYAIGIVWGFRYCLRHMMETAWMPSSDGIFEFVMFCLGAFCGGLVWPLTAVYAGLKNSTQDSDLRAVARMIAGETRQSKQRRRERDLADRERHVARLERELGIGQNADVVPL